MRNLYCLLNIYRLSILSLTGFLCCCIICWSCSSNFAYNADRIPMLFWRKNIVKQNYGEHFCLTNLSTVWDCPFFAKSCVTFTFLSYSLLLYFFSTRIVCWIFVAKTMQCSFVLHWNNENSNNYWIQRWILFCSVLRSSLCSTCFLIRYGQLAKSQLFGKYLTFATKG